MSQCRHVPKGFVTNQRGELDATRPHASVTVCDRPDCIRGAQSWVAGKTNETAEFYRFGSSFPEAVTAS